MGEGARVSDSLYFYPNRKKKKLGWVGRAWGWVGGVGGGGGAGVTFYHESKFKVKKKFSGWGGWSYGGEGEIEWGLE